MGTANCKHLAASHLQLSLGERWPDFFERADFGSLDHHLLALAASVPAIRNERLTDYLHLPKKALELAMPMLLSQLPKKPFDQVVDAVGVGEISKYRPFMDKHQMDWLRERLNSTTEALFAEVLALQQATQGQENQQEQLLEHANALKERVRTHCHNHFRFGIMPPERVTQALENLAQPGGLIADLQPSKQGLEKNLNPFEDAIPKSLRGRAVANHEYLKGAQGHYHSYVIEYVLNHYKIQQDKDNSDLDNAALDLTAVYAILFALVEDLDKKTLPSCNLPEDRKNVQSSIIAALEAQGINTKDKLLAYFKSYQ